jgi:hypothetical protein
MSAPGGVARTAPPADALATVPCHYLGATRVAAPTGDATLQAATHRVQQLLAGAPPEVLLVVTPGGLVLRDPQNKYALGATALADLTYANLLGDRFLSYIALAPGSDTGAGFSCHVLGTAPEHGNAAMDALQGAIGRLREGQARGQPAPPPVSPAGRYTVGAGGNEPPPPYGLPPGVGSAPGPSPPPAAPRPESSSALAAEIPFETQVFKATYMGYIPVMQTTGQHVVSAAIDAIKRRKQSPKPLKTFLHIAADALRQVLRTNGALELVAPVEEITFVSLVDRDPTLVRSACLPMPPWSRR